MISGYHACHLFPKVSAEPDSHKHIHKEMMQYQMTWEETIFCHIMVHVIKEMVLSVSQVTAAASSIFSMQQFELQIMKTWRFQRDCSPKNKTSHHLLMLMPNLYDFLSLVIHKRKFEECLYFFLFIFLHAMMTDGWIL